MSTVRHIAQGLAQSGLPQVAWRFRRARRSPGRAVVLMYHRVADDEDDEGLCVPPAVFDRQLELLCRRMPVLPLATLVDRLQQPGALETDVAAITFDDGYRDNLDSALPILQRRSLPATIFVTTGFVDGAVRPIHERLRDAVAALWAQHLTPTGWQTDDAAVDRLVARALATPGSSATVRALADHLKRTPWKLTQDLLACLDQLAGQPPTRRTPMLTWDDVRTLSQQGVEIASHTVSHAILSRLPLREAEDELRTSKQRLEAQLGQPVRGFAFPNGRRDDFTDDHVRVLGQLGYRYACTAERGVNRPGSNLLRLHRIGVGRDSQALLDLKLALGGPVPPCAA